MKYGWLKQILIGNFGRRRLLVDLIAVPLLVYAAITALARFRSERMLFVPQTPTYDVLDNMVTLRTSDGLAIRGVFLEQPGADLTVLFSHGNAEDLGDVMPWLEFLREQGFSVFCYDYRGYGRSDGRPSEMGVNLDIRAAYDYLVTDVGKPPGSIIAYGFSVGGGPSVHLASTVPVGGLILQSTFVSAYRVMTRIPLIPFDRFRNGAVLERVTCPVLVIHGMADRVIPFWHGEALYRQARSPKQKLWLEGVGHNDLPGPHAGVFAEALHTFADTVRSCTQPVLK